MGTSPGFSGGWPTLLSLEQTIPTVAAPPFAVFEGWEAGTSLPPQPESFFRQERSERSRITAVNSDTVPPAPCLPFMRKRGIPRTRSLDSKYLRTNTIRAHPGPTRFPRLNRFAAGVTSLPREEVL